MSSFRLAVWPFILLAACYTPLASALGLGEISLHSALAEPLEADIELIDARGLGADAARLPEAAQAAQSLPPHLATP